MQLNFAPPAAPPAAPRAAASRNSISRSTFVSITLDGGIMTIRPAGPTMSEREAVIISAEVNLALDAYGNSMRAFVLDLSDVQMMSSFGLGLCIELRNSAKAMRIPAVLFGLNPILGDLFKMMKVDRLYTIAQTPHELAKAIAA
jgi:anti-anti-sigma factor